MENRDDPAVDEVRELRRRVSQACGHDAARLVERYLRLQEQYRERLLGDVRGEDRAGQGAA